MKWVKIGVGVVLTALVTTLSTVSINPTNSDIPRHLLSGKLIVDAFLHGQYPSNILYHNAFSATYASYAFVNHHWLSAALFYLAFHATGWVGLHVFYLTLLLVTFAITYIHALRRGGLMGTLLSTAVLLPLLTTRTEVRPEAWSYLFVVLYLYILTQQKMTNKTIAIVLICQLFWANLHIYFVIGIAMVLWWSVVYSRNNKPIIAIKSKQHALLCIGIVAVSLLTPHGIRGLLYPFTIFQNYGYEIVENKSVWFLWNWGMHDPLYIHISVLAVVSVALIFINKSKTWRLGVFSLALTIWAMLGIRNIPLAALVTLPYLAHSLNAVIAQVAKTLRTTTRLSFTLLLFVAIVATLFVYGEYFSVRLTTRLKLGAIDTRSADAFIAKHVRGPVFNNYDVGSYLEWLIYPTPVYVDNRPEAYPVSFFKNDYVSMDRPDVFARLEQKYHFSTIVFQYHDLTPWSQNFLSERIEDSSWVPVFVDESVIVFAKNTPPNAALIKTYQISKSTFQNTR